MSDQSLAAAGKVKVTTPRGTIEPGRGLGEPRRRPRQRPAEER
jgi:hypothetical protein